MAGQLSLPFVYDAGHSADDFIITASNHDAWEAVNAWPNWPGKAMMLSGPVASGKSHLAHIWADKSQATLAPATLLGQVSPFELCSKGALALEDVEQARQQEDVFHLLNAARQSQCFLLLTGLTPAGKGYFTLPDLTSRLSALPQAELHTPDDDLLSALLFKHFSDRQLRISPEVANYLLPRMGRSCRDVSQLVEKIDLLALEEHSAVTLGLVRRVLQHAEMIEYQPG